jgi:hypothetical protein
MRRDDDVVTRAAGGSRGRERVDPDGGRPQGFAQPPGMGQRLCEPLGFSLEAGLDAGPAAVRGTSGHPPEGPGCQRMARRREAGTKAATHGAVACPAPRSVAAKVRALWLGPAHSRGRAQPQGPLSRSATGSGGRYRGARGRAERSVRSCTVTVGVRVRVRRVDRQALAGAGGLLGQHRRVSRPPRRPCGTADGPRVLRNAVLSAANRSSRSYRDPGPCGRARSRG